MKKDVDIYVEEELAEQIEELARTEKQIFADLNLNMQYIERSENFKNFEDIYYKNTSRNHMRD